MIFDHAHTAQTAIPENTLDLTALIAIICLMPFFKPIAKMLLRGILSALSGGRRKLPKAFDTTVFVIDGDTVNTNTGDIRVRMFGIDAPERGQAQGAASTGFLRSLTKGEIITVKPVCYDKYNRLVAILERKSDKADLSALMVNRGYALADRFFTKKYARFEKHARRTKKGLWNTGKIQNPSAYRAAIR